MIEGTDVYDEHERGGETKSALNKVKAKVEKLKDSIKHGHGHHYDDDTKTGEFVFVVIVNLQSFYKN